MLRHLMRFLQWDADLYQQNHNFVWKYGASLLDLVDLKPGESVLDVGCGTGELTQQLYQLSQGRVLGLDADPTMIRRAKEQFEAADSNKSLAFFVGDACQFQLDEPVNVVFSNAALHWVGRQGAPRAIEGISKSLAPKGRFVLEFGGKGNVDMIVAAVLKVMDLPRESADFWWYPSIAELSSLMEANGLEVTQAQLFDRPTELVGEEGLETWLRMFGNKFFEGKNESEIQGIIERVVEQCRPKLYKDGVWKADYRRIRVVGTKL